MDVFGVRERLIRDYKEFTESFVEIDNDRIRAHVAERLDAGYQWPEPWLSLNPNFASGGTITELVQAGLLHPTCERIFRLKEHGSDGPVLRLHQHQREAVELARQRHSYVLTTGTGSGKSLAYLIPIVDRVLRARASGGYRPGIKAIVIYPMNALANSQMQELTKFLKVGFENGPPVTFDRYTGQENEEERQRIIADPPDILLTNYVMLELVLTRPRERKGLIQAAQGLDFLVLDELHTYRGRQGADVALLVRRLREACAAERVQCVGTSATMTTEGDLDRQRAEVARVASTLFGIAVGADQVIGETLERVTEADAVSDAGLRSAVTSPGPPAGFAAFRADPLAAWVEETFGFEPGPASGVRRRRPLTVPDAAGLLRERTGQDDESCVRAIVRTLEAGARTTNPATGRPLFAFRLHQFLSKGDNVYVTIERPAVRHITSKYQVAAPGTGGMQKILLPLAFCRECGQEYLSVWRRREAGGWRFSARPDTDESGDRADVGYLFVSDDQPWPESLEEVLDTGRLPYSWVTSDIGGNRVIAAGKEKYLPETVRVGVDGLEATDGLPAAYVPSPFQFCLRCRVGYEQPRARDFGKLAKLSAEGRSSATSVISASIVSSLRAATATGDGATATGDGGGGDARKLLAFVDNRQDASLQAGHFNDFVQVTQLRGGLFRALLDEPDGLTHEVLPQRVTDALGLDVADFARPASQKRYIQEEARRALREVVGYRLYLDLERGWRVTMPNLEQTGLLRIDYLHLTEIAADEEVWDGCHWVLRGDEPEHRYEVAAALLDELRRNLAIDVPYLTEDGFKVVLSLSEQHLKEPWSLSDRERPPLAVAAFAGPGRSGRARRGRRDIYLSGLGAFGRYVRRAYEGRASLRPDDATEIIADLLHVLGECGLLIEIPPVDGGSGSGYQLRAAVIRWLAGDGKSGAEDRVRRALDPGRGSGARVNPFFRDFYREHAATLAGLRAKEHTAQVPPEDRQEREREFNENLLPILYCSPTMELGVDIRGLNAVALRNMPPTPANYAQRSGRAGRSGQPALVVAYCATGNAHDQYYFRHPTDMVGGAVAPPRLDLANEALVRSHVHAIWLAETGQDLYGSLTQILDATGERPSLEVKPDVWRKLNEPGARERARAAALAAFHELIPRLRGALAASQLATNDPELTREQLKQAVVRDYGHKSASYQEQRLTEFERFLHQMREGELVLTVSHGHAFLGEIAGPAYFTESEGGRSNLRRDVRWLNAGRPIFRDDLRAPLPALLADQLYVVDLTEAEKELSRLAEPFREQPRSEPARAELAFPPITKELADDLLLDEEWLREVADRLWHRKQIVLYGPPGTGKTWLARKLARHLTGGQDPVVKLVQFHPSYTYEDFFEGFRPRGVNGQLTFELRSGPFRTFAEDAKDNPATPYILIIDEINRANLAKVFGELYFLLEYRDAAISLQYSPTETFSLPENVFIIGTMNTADRSIALVDAAMRRRFAFIELHPRTPPVNELLRKWLRRKEIDTDAAELLDALNERIEDEDYAIGPSYFMHREIYDRPDGIALVWRTEIMPLLEELHYGQGRTAIADKYDLAAIRKAVAARQATPDTA
jgi:MoxR-like ATPase